MMSKAVFPPCASFGPLFIAIGHLLPAREAPWGFFPAVLGAVMTSVALMIIHRELSAVTENNIKPEPRNTSSALPSDSPSQG